MPNLTETGEREQFRIGCAITHFFNDLLITLYGLLSKFLIKATFIDYKIEIVVRGIKSPLPDYIAQPAAILLALFSAGLIIAESKGYRIFPDENP